MSTLDPASSGHLAELLVSAAERLAAPAPPAVVLAPMGVPVRAGRLHHPADLLLHHGLDYLC